MKLFNACEETLGFSRDAYANNNNLAIQIWVVDEETDDIIEPFSSLTTNLGVGVVCDKNKAFIDHNCPNEIIEMLEKNGYCKPTGRNIQSGFVLFKEYEFTEEFLTEVVEVEC